MLAPKNKTIIIPAIVCTKRPEVGNVGSSGYKDTCGIPLSITVGTMWRKLRIYYLVKGQTDRELSALMPNTFLIAI